MRVEYLPLYYEWMKTKRLPKDGLCNSLDDVYDASCFEKLFENNERGYWGFSGGWNVDYQKASVSRCHYEFTPLRQTMLLFMAAMNGEFEGVNNN